MFWGVIATSLNWIIYIKTLDPNAKSGFNIILHILIFIWESEQKDAVWRWSQNAATRLQRWLGALEMSRSGITIKKWLKNQRQLDNEELLFEKIWGFGNNESNSNCPRLLNELNNVQHILCLTNRVAKAFRAAVIIAV